MDALFLEHKNIPLITIGRICCINDYVYIGCVNSITIGDEVLIASKVFITDHNHGSFNINDDAQFYLAPAKRNITFSRVIIGNWVWIGESVIILLGVEIGNNVIIGAGSVVTRSIYSNTIAVGNPAKHIKIFDETLEKRVPVK